MRPNKLLHTVLEVQRGQRVHNCRRGIDVACGSRIGLSVAGNNGVYTRDLGQMDIHVHVSPAKGSKDSEGRVDTFRDQ